IQAYRDDSQCDELREHVPPLGVNKLGNKGEKEESGLGVQNFRCNALAKSSLKRGGLRQTEAEVAGANHANAKVHQIGCPGVLHHSEGYSGGGQNGRHAQGGAKTWNMPPSRVPAAESMPSRRPPARVRVST